jgi:hypothetical protein
MVTLTGRNGKNAHPIIPSLAGGELLLAMTFRTASFSQGDPFGKRLCENPQMSPRAESRGHFAAANCIDVRRLSIGDLPKASLRDLRDFAVTTPAKKTVWDGKNAHPIIPSLAGGEPLLAMIFHTTSSGSGT